MIAPIDKAAAIRSWPVREVPGGHCRGQRLRTPGITSSNRLVRTRTSVVWWPGGFPAQLLLYGLAGTAGFTRFQIVCSPLSVRVSVAPDNL